MKFFTVINEVLYITLLHFCLFFSVSELTSVFALSNIFLCWHLFSFMWEQHRRLVSPLSLLCSLQAEGVVWRWNCTLRINNAEMSLWLFIIRLHQVLLQGAPEVSIHKGIYTFMKTYFIPEVCSSWLPLFSKEIRIHLCYSLLGRL